jgi:DNA-binding response OmpR family regulator
MILMGCMTTKDAATELTGRILIVEDDADINGLLAKVLAESGHDVTSAYSGSEARLLLQGERFDCILLDLMLPGIDGETLIQHVRERFTMPIIVVSAKLGTDARVTALRLGADDFMPKPFEHEEVLARVEAQLRRSRVFSQGAAGAGQECRHKNCVLDTGSMTAEICGNAVDFTALEYQVFSLFMQNPKRVFTRGNIFALCWDQDYMGDDNTIDVHISHIRNKIAKYDDDEYIKTVRGIGYRLSQ